MECNEGEHVWVRDGDGVVFCRICGTKRRGEGRMFVSMKLASCCHGEVK